MTQARDLANFISNGLADTAEVADGAITEAKLASASVTDTKVASGITGTKISYDNSVSGISANTMQEAVDYLNALSGGSSGSVASYTRSKFTATAGQTTFAVTYQVGYLEVYLNGVLLDITDYAASDGTSVVLAVGASAGDEIVTIALDSFAIAELLRIFSTSASAPDDSVTVDASGNLLVGMTTTPAVNGWATEGFAYINGDYMAVTRDQNITAYFNRTTSDGDIVAFRKDGTTVGSIGNSGSGVEFSSPDTVRVHASNGVRLYDNVDGGIILASSRVYPSNPSGSTNDATISLGSSTARFKDLYLSGGVYLGGTGAANLLDDYETGTFTPTLGSTYGFTKGTVEGAIGRYTKVGNLVHCFITFTTFGTTEPAAAGDRFQVTGLPFTASDISGSAISGYVGSVHVYASLGSGHNSTGIATMDDINAVYAVLNFSQGVVDYADNIFITISYRTDA